MGPIFDVIIGDIIPIAVTIFLCAVFTQIIYNVKFSLKTTFLYVAVTMCAVGLVIAFSTNVLFRISDNFEMIFRTAASFLILVSLLKYFFKLSISKCLISLGLFYIILGIGNAVSNAFFNHLGIKPDRVNSSLTVVLAASLIINAVIIIILFVIKSFKMFSSLPQELRTKAHRSNIIYIFFILVLIALNFSYFERFNTLIDSVTIIVNVLLLVGFFVFSVYNTNTIFKLETKSQELEYQTFYNKALDSLIQDLRRFKHNYNNMLAVVGGYIKTKRWDGLEKYYQEICNELGKVGFLDNLTSLNIKSAGILGLIMSKYEYAQEKGVTIRVTNDGELNEVRMKISELCEILGILFDNAIEAASESESKLVEVFIKNTDGIISFTFENSINGEININSIYTQGYSTKGEGRGIGLWLLKRIIDKYKNVILNTQVEEKKFKQEIIIN